LEKTFTWSYDSDKLPRELLVEHTLVYGDVSDIKNLIENEGLESCKKVWQERILIDSRFKKLNYFLARFIFNISDNPLVIERILERSKVKRIDKIRKILNTKD
jgi:hypothetical protein